MLTQESLRPYVSSAEQTRSTDVGAGSREARQAVRRLRRLLRAGIANNKPSLTRAQPSRR